MLCLSDIELYSRWVPLASVGKSDVGEKSNQQMEK